MKEYSGTLTIGLDGFLAQNDDDLIDRLRSIVVGTAKLSLTGIGQFETRSRELGMRDGIDIAVRADRDHGVDRGEITVSKDIGKDAKIEGKVSTEKGDTSVSVEIKVKI